METVDKLTEMVACEHLPVVWQPLVLSKVPHAWVRCKALYVIVEEGKVKLICPDCFKTATVPALFTRSELH